MDLLNKNSTQIYLQIVMDIGYPMTVGNLQNILNALKNVLAVGYSIQNSGEAAFSFGFSSMNDIFQSIAPFEEKRNFATTWSILKELQNMIRSNIQITMQEYEDMIHLALKSAIEEYSSKQRLARGRFDNKSFVEILIITRKYAHNFNSCIERISENLNINQLKRIQILKLIDNDSEVEGDEEETENEKSPLVKNVKATIDSEIDNHIKRCIFDSYSNLGEMILYMPNKTIYCDFSFYNISSKTCKLDLSKVQKMEVVHRLAADGLCESHIFGDPMRVTPSCKVENCMQQIVNRNAFKALCDHLNESDEYLIVRQKCYAFSSSTYDYFVLRPGADCMLMKSVCSGEMVLPDPLKSISTGEEKSIQEYVEVAYSLRHVARAEEYLPNHFQSGLLPSLLSQPVASVKQGSALIKRNQYNKLEIQVKKKSFHSQVDCEYPRTVSQDDNIEPTSNKRRMLLPLDAHQALLNTVTAPDQE